MTNTAKAGTKGHETHGSDHAMNRRTTLALAVTTVVGVAAGSRQADAEPPMSKDGAMSTAKPPKPASVSQFQDLKAVGPQGQVEAIYHHHDGFEIMTADGRSAVLKEADLRFKIDTSNKGPLAGRPVILPGGMMGDRATLFFASAAEIGDLVKYRG